MNTVELVAPSRAGSDRRAPRGAVGDARDLRADREGFLGARLVGLSGNEWLDIVDLRSPEDFAASRAKGANLPGIAAFLAAIDEVISSEEGHET